MHPPPPANVAATNAGRPPASALAWTLGLALVLPSLVTLVYFTLLHGTAPVFQQTAYALGKALQFSLPLYVAWRGWGGSLEWPRPGRRGLLVGGLFGLAVCGLLFVAFQWMFAGQPSEELLLRAAREKLASTGLDRPAAFLAIGLFYSAAHSLLEEYYWRWFVFGRGQSVWGLAAANVISSLGFMAHHILLLGHFLGFAQWRTYLLAGAIAIGGAFWAWLFQRTGNLAASWFSHALVDAGIFGLGYWLLFY